MKHSVVISFAVSILGAVVSTSASAELVTNGFMGTVTFRDCSQTGINCNAPLTGPFSPGGAFNEFSQTGAIDLIAPETGTRFADLGSGSAATALTGGVLAPELKAEIDTIDGASVWMSSQALAVQRYVNTGADSMTIALNIAADWLIAGGLTPTGGLPNGLAYEISIFENNNGLINLDLSGNLVTLQQLAALAEGIGVDNAYWVSSNVFGTTGTVDIFSPTLTLGAGQGFFVAARLVAFGGWGATVDAFNTFETAFTDANHNLLGASSALKPVGVPEPDTVSLVAAGLVGMVLLRRRRKLLAVESAA